MHVVSRKKLLQFWEKHKDAEDALKEWFKEAEHATGEPQATSKPVMALPILFKEIGLFSMLREISFDL
jgi:mRNA-degrading endonuclease HigB of HigAB toxin-antitoxin module